MKREHHKLAGLVVSVFDMQKGETLPFNSTAPAGQTQDKIAHQAMQAMGDCSVIRPDGTAGAPYPEGCSNEERPPYPMPGVYRLVAETDGRHICVTTQERAGRFNGLAVRATAGEAIHIPKGGLLVLGKGKVTCRDQEFSAFRILSAETGDLEATVIEPVNGIVAWL